MFLDTYFKIKSFFNPFLKCQLFCITPHWEATLERTLGRSLLQKPKNNQLHDESKGRKPYFRIILEDFRFGIYLTLSLKNIGRTRWPEKLPDICKLHVVKITRSWSTSWSTIHDGLWDYGIRVVGRV